MTLGERLRMVRKAQKPKMTQKDFGESIGVSGAAYGVYEIDRVVPTDTVLKLICMQYHVNPCWLADGEGEMFIDRPDERATKETLRKLMPGQSEFAVSVVAALTEMPPEWWDGCKILIDKISREA